jgi:hypothetical protein
MRKFKEKGDPRNSEEDFSFLYIISFVNFSNELANGWNLWENGPVFSKKNMEIHVA